ncbi:acyltransferase [Gordonia rubripertincta]|nr:acyltransferase [Gordonia rubripertincta]
MDSKVRRFFRNYRRDVLLNTIFASGLFPKPLRWRALRASGMGVSKSSIASSVFFGSTRVSIGEETYVSYGCFFDSLAPISIGRRCSVGMRVSFVTSDHEVGIPPMPRAAGEGRRPIVVGDYCWIGAGAIILPGVVVGEGCIISAGAVVIRDCEPNGLYAGVPAIRKRDLPTSM